MKHFIYRNAVVLCCLWTLVIFILCATPGQYIPSADWLELLSFDKLVHAGMFFILTALLLLALIKHQQSAKKLGFGIAMVIAYGASLEIMQATCFSNRSADWKDMVANTFGCVVAVSTLKKLRKFSGEQSEKKRNSSAR